MPFATLDELPDNIKKLSQAKQEAWRGAWNGRYEDCRKDGATERTCESSAFAVANDAVTKDLDPEESAKFYSGMVEQWDIYGVQFPQEDVNYSTLGSTDDRGCANCRWFVAPGACIIVSSYPDPITPNGLSTRWEAKTPFVQEPLQVVIVGEEKDQPDLQDDDEKATKTVTIPQRVFATIKLVLQSVLRAETKDETPGAFALYKDLNGDMRWFMRVSNHWRDRDYPPEILSGKAHREYEAYVDRTGNFPEAWLWHTPGSKWGKTDWVTYDGGFFLASGTVDPGMEHVADWLAKQKGLGVSHGFNYLHSDPGEGIIGWYRTFEVSPLPAEAAANPWTSIEVIQKDMEGPMNIKKLAFLEAALGKDVVARIGEDTASMKAALEAKGVEWKEVPEDDPVILNVSNGASIDMKALALESGKAVAEALVETKAFTDMVAGQATLGVQLKDLVDRVGLLEKSDDEKVAALVGARDLRARGHRASASDENILNPGSKEALDAKNKDGGPTDWFGQVIEAVGAEAAP